MIRNEDNEVFAKNYIILQAFTYYNITIINHLIHSI